MIGKLVLGPEDARCGLADGGIERSYSFPPGNPDLGVEAATRSYATQDLREGAHAILERRLMLHRYGTEEQKHRWLLLMVRGENFPSVGMTEPEVAGSDPTPMCSRARFEGDHIVLDAHKWFTTGADNAAFTTIFAETDPDAESRHRRFSAISVPTDIPGYRVARVVPTMGHLGGAHCEIRIEGARVPAANLLGGRADGFVIAQQRLGPDRIFHCTRWLGQAQRAFELMTERANSRYAHGSRLAEKDEIQQYVAESAAQIQAHR